HARMVAVVPFYSAASSGDENAEGTTQTASGRDGNEVIGAMVVEQFTTVQVDEAFMRRVNTVARHGDLALRNALAVDQLPLISLNRALAKVGWLVRAKQLPKTIAALVGVAAIVLALWLIPADFRVESEGELQPTVQQEIFAPVDGIVQQVQTKQ